MLPHSGVGHVAGHSCQARRGQLSWPQLRLNNLGYFRSNSRRSALCLRFSAFNNRTIARGPRLMLIRRTHAVMWGCGGSMILIFKQASRKLAFPTAVRCRRAELLPED